MNGEINKMLEKIIKKNMLHTTYQSIHEFENLWPKNQNTSAEYQKTEPKNSLANKKTLLFNAGV